MNISMKKILFLLLSCSVSITSCDLDINVDPNSPSAVPNGQLLSAAQVAIFTSFGHNGSGLGQPASIWVHQVMIRSNADQYGSTGQDANINNPWLNLFSGAMQDLETIITQGNALGEFQYVGVAKLLKAYSFHMMVDAWGDIPFTEAVKGTRQPFPRFDNDAEIYASLFSLIDEALTDLAKPAPSIGAVPGADDLVYGGNLTSWRRFGKATKLKMYNTISGVQNVNSDIAALVADPDIVGFTADFELNYRTLNAPENRNPAWVSVSGATTYFSIYFYEILNNRSLLNPILSGIVDPRLPYYMYNSLGSGNPNPQNPVEYRDGNFLSIYFASQGTNQGFDQSRGLSMPGVYFCGGVFDPAGVGGSVLISSAPGNAPQRLFNRFSLTFLRAEIALRNNNLAQARTLLSEGIDQAFDKVNAITTSVYPTAATIPATARDSYRTAVLAKWDTYTTNAQRLEMIMTQKWIANFGNPLDSYSDYRRTGFPMMFDPNNDGIPFTNLGRVYPFSFPYRQLDLQLNPNAPAQKLIGDPSARVFWDVN